MDAPSWAVWVVAAVALAGGELLTPGLFYLGPLAIAAAAAAVTASLAGTSAAVLTFIVAALVSLAVLRPLVRRHVHVPAVSRTGTAALVGAPALVLEQVDAHGGRVKIGGEEWSARAFLPGETLPPGEHVEVAQIDGATALVV